MSIESRTLKQHTGSALKWNYLGVAVRSLSSLLIGIVLARLLGPKPFGLVTVAMLVIGLGNLLADLGFSNAIIQRKTLCEKDIRFAFTFQMLLGVIFAIVCFAGAGVIASLFRSQEVTPVIRALSLIFPLQAFGQTASSLLKRRLAFRALQYAQISSYAVNLVVGIPLAVGGLGVWALVVAQLVSISLNSVIAYWMSPHSLLFCFRINRSILGFGVKVVSTNVANWSIGNLDNLVVGRVFGVLPLALYSRAFQLTNLPIVATVSTLQNVLFAAYSRVQSGDDTFRRVYLATVAVMSVIMVPMFGAAAVVSSTIILALYGRAWIGAAPLFVPLALAMPLYAILALAGPVLWAAGRVERELKVQVVTAIMALVVFAATSRISPVCLAWGVLAVYAFRFLGMTREVVRHLKIKWVDIVLALRGGVAVGLATAVLSWIADSLMKGTGVPVMLRLSVVIAVALSAVLLSLAVTPNAVLGPPADLVLSQLRLMMPDSLRRFVPSSQIEDKVGNQFAV
jgi:O-antigen/teichoic acid export membrane protein